MTPRCQKCRKITPTVKFGPKRIAKLANSPFARIRFACNACTHVLFRTYGEPGSLEVRQLLDSETFTPYAPVTIEEVEVCCLSSLLLFVT